MNVSKLKTGSEEEQDTLSCPKDVLNVPKKGINYSSSVSSNNECDTSDSKNKEKEHGREFHGTSIGEWASFSSLSSLSNSTAFSELSFPRLSISDHLANTKCLGSLSLARQGFLCQPTTLSAAKENERLSITIPQIGHDTCGSISPSPSLLMTSSSQCLTPSSPASVIPPSVPPFRRDGEITEGVNKILFLNDDSLEEEKIDVCTVKELQSIVNNDKNVNKNEKENLVQHADEEEIDTCKKDSTSHFYSYLGSQCSRTVPSLMKFYSKHKRSLSTSLSVTLAVSGQSTPPCSPISPGSTSVLPSFPKRSLEASTMTSPTDRTMHASSDCLSSLIQKEKQKYSVDNSQAASSSLTALTLLTIPNLSTDKSVSPARLSPVGDMKDESKLGEDKPNISRVDESDGLICRPPRSVSLENSSVDTPVCSIPSGMPFPTPWSLPHNAIPHPGSFWLHSGVDPGTGLNLGYHVARDPLTGHLFIISRHPMADPNGHGLMWAGYGGVPAPHMMMSSQQLLLDPRYRPSLPPPPSLMQMHHSHPALHPQQQQQPARNFNVTNNKEASKKSPIPISEEATNQTSDLPMQSLPPPNIPPHYLYPPTTIPYYYPQPTHPNPFGLPAYTQRPIPAPSLGLTTAMQNNLLTPLTSNIFASSSSTLTTTTSESILLSEKLTGSCVSSISKESIAQIRNGAPIADVTNNLVSDPIMNQTDSHSMKSCLYEVRTSSEGKGSSRKEDSAMPNSIHIKEEIKEEENFQCCLVNKECDRHIPSHNFISLKVESNTICTPTPDDTMTNASTCAWESTDVSKHIDYENSSLDTQKNNTNILSSNEIHDSVDNYENPDTNVASTAQKNVIDSSGLELLLQTFLQHGDRLAPSPQAKDSDQDSVSSISEQMPHLERVTNTPSPRVSPASFESQPPVLTPFTLRNDTESPQLPSSPTIHHPLDNVLEDPIPHFLPPKPSGLSVLCALAEQRILEEQQNSCSALSSLAEVASSTPSVPMNSPLSEISQEMCSSIAIPELIAESSSFNVDVPEASQVDPQMVSNNNCSENNTTDINRNYKSPRSEREARAFIANKVSQYQKEISTEEEADTAVYQLGTMKAVERDMKMKLADLQRQYKLKQRELSRLHPKKEFIGVRRRRGRPPKLKLSSIGDMESKSVTPSINADLEQFPSVIQNNSESRIEAHDGSSFMQATSPSSMQNKTQSNINISKSWQLKMEDSSDEDEVRTSPSKSLPHEASFKSPHLLVHPKLEESEEGHQNKYEKTETSVESSTSDVEQHSVSSSSKKRKPGRPKKHSLTKYEATETIVAKKPKGFEFLLVSHKPKIRPKLKAELKVRSSEQEDETSSITSQITFNNPAIKEENAENKDDQNKTANVCKGMRRRGGLMGRSSVSRNTLLRDKEKRKSVFEKNSRMQELFRSLKRYSTIAAAEHDESEDEKEYKPVLTCEKKKESIEEESHNNDLNGISSAHVLPNEQANNDSELPEVSVPSEQTEVQVKTEPNVSDDISPSIANLPVIPCEEIKVKVKEEEPIEETVESNDNNVDKGECSVCSLQIDDLVPRARVLILQDGLLYAGSLSPITPPDVYGIHIDGERGTRHHIYCQEDLLTQAWKEVKPGSTRFLTEGTRVCAFWSQQYRGLYPGCVAAACSPSHEGNHNLVNVEFDDGDSGRIHVDDIRLLPQHFPIIEYDPNPLLTLNKRKRRLTGEDSGDVKLSQQKQAKVSQNEQRSVGSEENENCAVAEKDSEQVEKKIKQRKKQKRKKIPQSFLSRDDRKRHKKRKKTSDLFLIKHKHRRKHKRKRKPSEVFPHVEQGDNELRMRIKSPPPPMKEEQVSNTSSEDEMDKSENDEPSSYQPQRRKKRSPSEKSKMAPFLLERQLWRWFGKGYRRPGSKGKGKKLFYKEIVRGKEHIRVGDCAVFLSSGSHERPFIGKIDFLWEGWGGNMVVKVRWFYHPDETMGTERKLSEPKGALFSSSHTDENDVQTISHKCHVVSLAEYRVRRAELDRKHGQDYENFDLYYLSGFYDPTYSRITMEPGVS